MKLRVEVRWPNAHHVLLAGKAAVIEITTQGQGVVATKKYAGRVEFELPEGTTSFELSARFAPAFAAVKGPANRPDLAVPELSAEVLRIVQPFEVADGTAIRAVALPQYGGPHPLVDVVTAANVHGAASVRLATEFVDIGSFWGQYAIRFAAYAARRDADTPGMQLDALGYTGGDPKIWFASYCPAKLTESSNVSCLAFFRPESDGYTRIDQRHDNYQLTRYLLAPIPGAAKPADADVIQHDDDAPGMGYPWLRAGFERALLRSEKPLVMLHPWPSGTDFGQAATSKLPGLAAAATRFLWAQGKIAKNLANVRLGRFGISGYSGGGFALWRALRANAKHIDELYAFDTVNAVANGGHAIQWFLARQAAGAAPCLRMTGGSNLTALAGVARALTEKLKAAASDVTAWPMDRSGYELGENPLWDHAVQLFPSMRENIWFWHQFAVFGGLPAPPGPDAKTFLQAFLEQSLF